MATKFIAEQFGGMNLLLNPSMIPDKAAQEATDCELEEGVLNPLRAPKDDGDGMVGVNSKSMYNYNGTWLSSDNNVDICPVPNQNDKYDRIIMTTNEEAPMYPVVYSNGATYRCGIPFTTDVVQAVAQNPPLSGSDLDVETVTYVMTLVDAWGVEGPPCEPSEFIDRVADTPVNLDLPDAPSGNYNFGSGALKRVYRSVSGASNSVYLGIGEYPITTTSVVDETPVAHAQEPLPSLSWVGPPDDDTTLYPDGPMIGITQIANGMMAGFAGRQLCFNEAFLYHAWPPEYRITMDDPIVAIASITGGLLVVTTKRPYLVSGVHPSSMAVTQIEDKKDENETPSAVSLACVSRHGMVDMGGYALYPSPDGLVMVEASTAVVITKNLVTPTQWKGINPSTIRAFSHEGTYVGFYEGTPNAGFIFDPRRPDTALRLISPYFECGSYDFDTGRLLVNDNGTIKSFMGDEDHANGLPYRWKSKRFVAPRQVSLSVARVEAEQPLSTNPVTMEVHADGVLRDTVIFDEDVFQYKRLSSGYRAKRWEFVLTGTNPVVYAGIFETMDEVI